MHVTQRVRKCERKIYTRNTQSKVFVIILAEVSFDSDVSLFSLVIILVGNLKI